MLYDYKSVITFSILTPTTGRTCVILIDGKQFDISIYICMYACRTMAVGRVDELRTRGLKKNRPCFIFPNINILIINIQYLY